MRSSSSQSRIRPRIGSDSSDPQAAPKKAQRTRGVSFFDDVIMYDTFPCHSFKMRVRVGAQRLGKGKYRVYTTAGFNEGWSKVVDGHREF